MDAFNIAGKAGFEPLSLEFKKPDPRGAEYGNFILRPVGERFTITKVSCSGYAVYVITIDGVDQFRNWAAENT